MLLLVIQFPIILYKDSCGVIVEFTSEIPIFGSVVDTGTVISYDGGKYFVTKKDSNSVNIYEKCNIFKVEKIGTIKCLDKN